MKIEKKLITLMLVWVMLVTCIPMQQANAKITGAKVAVTRAEWVSALLKQADIKTGKISKYHFSDTKKNAKGKVIETAYARGILPVKKKSKKFYPNKAATREFMAVTAVRALGFQADKGTSPKCKDKKTLNYPSEDKVALNQKILSLKKKKFLPNKAITKSEKKNALRVVKKIRNTGKVDSKHKNVIKYQKNVDNISASTQTNYTVKEQGNQLVVSVSKNEYTQNLQTGKVVIFPKESGTQNQIALKIKNITDIGNGRVEITGETPDIAEVYQKIDLQKKKQVDMSAFVPNDDVVASVGNLSNGLKGATAQVTTSVGNGKTLELKEIKLGDAGTFSGSVQLPAPKITAIVDADFSNPLNPLYREISVSLSEDVVAKAELKFSSKGRGSGKIYLGHVSAYLGEGFYADVVFYLNISVDGKATIQYTLSNTLTASYINGDFRMNASCNGSWDGTQAEVNGQLLGEPQVNLRFLGCWFDDKLYGAIDIIGMQADAGAKLKATATVHDKKPKLCTNLDLYSYVSVGVNTDMGIGKWLKNHTKLTLTKVILDNNAANPLRGTWHYEDGKRTEGDKCTYKNKQSKNQQNEKQENKATEIQAAEKYKTINLAQQEKQKVGTTEFYANYSNETERWNVYWKKGEKEGKFGSDQNVSPSIFTNGKIAYYVVEQYDSTISKCVFYKTDLQNGKTNKLFGVNNEEDGAIVGVYGNKIYCTIGIDPGNLYCYNLKTQKKKKVMADVTTAVMSGKYLVCHGYEGDPSPQKIRVYNMKNNKAKTLAKQIIAYHISGNKMYYAEYIKNYNKTDFDGSYIDYYCNIVCSNLDGTGKKALMKNRRVKGQIDQITSSYFTYRDSQDWTKIKKVKW